MPSWPATLPAPMVAGYALNPVDMTARTEMEAGPARVRRRSSARVDMVPVRWSMTDAQMAIFRAWFDAPFLGNAGASWFSVNLLLGEGGFQTVEARFSGIWQAAYIPHMRWEVQATLEIRHAPAPRWYYHETLEIPSLDLNFSAQSYSYYDGLTTQEPSNPFASFITFTRTTTATYFGADGLLKTAAINEPRIEYDPITGECKGLLIEESRTNLVGWSDTFNSVMWSKFSTSVSHDMATAPNGGTGADKLIEDTSSAQHRITQGVTVADNTVLTASIFVKAAERTRCRLSINAKDSTFPGAFFDLELGFVVSTVSSPLSVDITPIGDGWFRLSVAANVKSGASPVGLNFYLIPGGSTISYTGDGTSGLYIWGAQLEAGSFPTSYIKTEATAVTRGADNASVTGANFSSWYRNDEGTIVGRSVRAHPVPTGSYATIAEINDGFSNNRLFLSYNTETAAAFGSRTLGVIGININIPTNTRERALAGAYSAASSSASLNGGETINMLESNVPVVNKLDIGSGRGASYLNGHISRLTYWPKRLTNARLQELTT